MTIIELLHNALPGSQAGIAKAINVSQPAIHKWMTGKGKPSAKNAIAIERATSGRISRHDLRPDVFGPAPDQQAARHEH